MQCRQEGVTEKWFILCLSIIVGITNNFFSQNWYVMIGLVVLEMFILAYHAVLKRYDKFILMFVLFLSSSLENSAFVNRNLVDYGFKSFKIFGVNLSVYVLIIFTLIFLANIGNIVISKYKPLRNLQIGSLLLIPVGLMAGAVSIISNYNGITRYNGFLTAYLRWGYTYAMIALEVFVFSQVIYRAKSLQVFKNYLLYIALGQICAAVLSSLLQNYYYVYGEISGRIAPVTIIHLTYLILFPIYKDYKKNEKYVILLLAVLNIITTIMFAGGQFILMMAVSPLVLAIILYEDRRIKRLLLYSIICITIAGIAIPLIFSFMLDCSDNAKVFEELSDVASLLEFWKEGWIQNIHHSPKVRVAEVINIVYQYIKAPWSAFFGRGFLGTYTDELGLLDIVVSADYQEWERNLKIYSSVHESFTQFLLYFGLYGAVFYINTMKNIIVNLSKSPWLLIGLVWFGLHFAFSMAAISYGALCLVVGFYDALQHTKRKVLNEENSFCRGTVQS